MRVESAGAEGKPGALEAGVRLVEDFASEPQILGTRVQALHSAATPGATILYWPQDFPQAAGPRQKGPQRRLRDRNICSTEHARACSA